MNIAQARKILQCMLDGVDPGTGEILPADHLVNSPEVIRALHTAVMMMAQQESAPVLPEPEKGQDEHTVQESPAWVNKNGRLNAGRPWTQHELEQLRQMYRAGTTMEEMCEKLQRRRRGVEKMVRQEGLAGSSREEKPGLERAGKPWLAEENELLQKLFDQRTPIEEMAKELHRSTYSVFCRMERLGMYDEDVQGYPRADGSLVRPWSPKDNSELRRMAEESVPLAEIALCFGRSEKAIQGRMFAMGLSRESPLPPLKHQEE